MKPTSSRKQPTSNPTPAEIRALRRSVGLTQTQAAALIHSNLRTWQGWEGDITHMHPGLWELLQLKIAQLQAAKNALA